VIRSFGKTGWDSFGSVPIGAIVAVSSLFDVMNQTHSKVGHGNEFDPERIVKTLIHRRKSGHEIVVHSCDKNRDGFPIGMRLLHVASRSDAASKGRSEPRLH
jgi:hypothetical protein